MSRHHCLDSWRKVITEAEARGRFRDIDKMKAANWDTCAVGDANTRHPDRVVLPVPDRRPLDDELTSWGLEFSRAVDRDNFKEARRALAEIQIRLNELGARE